VAKAKAPLSATHPDLAAQWHPTKNGNLTPDQVVAGSNKRVWWKCPKGPDHEWAATLGNRSRAGSGCPFCAGQAASITNSLAALHPDLAAQWHPTKNGNKTPDQVPAGSQKRVWWKCPKGPDHEWEAIVSSRSRAGAGCPCCAGRAASVTNSLATLHPAIAAQWHPTKNGNKTPDQVPSGSTRKYWWKCPKGPDHEWEASVENRVRFGSGCPYCRSFKFSVTNSRRGRRPN
jgi:hypothetical protein